MVTYGKYRVVAKTYNGKPVYCVKRGNVLISQHTKYGKAAADAIKYSRAEKTAARLGRIGLGKAINVGEFVFASKKKQKKLYASFLVKQKQAIFKKIFGR